MAELSRKMYCMKSFAATESPAAPPTGVVSVRVIAVLREAADQGHAFDRQNFGDLLNANFQFATRDGFHQKVALNQLFFHHAIALTGVALQAGTAQHRNVAASTMPSLPTPAVSAKAPGSVHRAKN